MPEHTAVSLDAILDRVRTAYSQSLLCTPADVADDRFLIWCLAELEATYNVKDPQACAIRTIEQGIRDLQAITDALTEDF